VENKAEAPPQSARFDIVRRIGKGGMGVVYEAFDRELEARVAIKAVRQTTADTLLRFKNEFRTLADLEHPNLVRLGELIEDRGQWFFTMELIDGVHFLRWVYPHGSRPTSDELTIELPHKRDHVDADDDTPPTRIDERRLRSSIEQLARGLAALHAANKVHRDIKPSNILVTRQGRVVLLDFGIVLDVLDRKEEAVLLGTVSYMAPEQAAGEDAFAHSDLYAVGVLLYQALTGRLPVRGKPEEILLLKREAAPVPPDLVTSGVPSDLSQLAMDLLSIDPKARPTAREVLARLNADPGREPIATPRFVGRERELRTLRDAFLATRRAKCVCVMVEGESGVGKSALARRFTRSLTLDAHGVVVLAGRCYERESVPYKAVDGVIDALSRWLTSRPMAEAMQILPSRADLLGQVFPVMRKVPGVPHSPKPELTDPQEVRRRLFEAVRELFDRLSSHHPLVLVIDDLQWADADSMALLAEIVRKPGAPSLLLVGTLRTGQGEVHDVRAALGDVTPLALGALPPEDAEALVRATLEGAGGDVGSAGEIAREAQGHPLFIDELVRARVTMGPDVVLRLDEALWARISRIDHAARDALALIAVAGRPMRQEIAARASGPSFYEHVARLRSASLVRTGGPRPADPVEPYHDRVREAVLAKLDREGKRACHERLAIALERSGADAEELSIHWAEAGDAAKGATLALRAADEAAEVWAFDRAVRLFRRALELSPSNDERAVRRRLGDALANAGRGPAAAEAYLKATAGAHGTELLELQRRAAEQLLRSGHIDEGLAVIRTVLRAFGTKLPDTPRGALLALLATRARVRLRGLGFTVREAHEDELRKIDAFWSVAAGLTIVDTIRAADFQARALLLALGTGEPSRIARSIAAEAGFSAAAGGPARQRTERLLEAARSIATELDEPFAHGMVAACTGLAAFCEGRFIAARTELDRAENIFLTRCTGASWELHTCQIYALIALTYSGDLVELARRHPMRLREAEERGNLYAATSLRTAMCSLIFLVPDEPERARAELERAIDEWTRTGFHLQHYWNIVQRATIDLYEGAEPQALYARVVERWSELERSLLLRIQIVHVEALHVRARAAIVSGELEQASKDARAIEREAMAWSDPIAALIHAGIAAKRGQTEEAVRELEAAVDGFDRSDMALLAACARLRCGQLVGGDKGAALIAQARAWMASRHIVSPERMAQMFAPGFD
jgi:tRNA A-37 threonylcarbamoyl transferase component Bud32/tetratricopeptide (TPR) repeat protein